MNSELTSIGRFYDEAADFCGLALGTGAIHHGYFDGPDDPSTLAQAHDQMTRLAGRQLRLHSSSRLLDIGCGTGQPTLLLADESGCSAVGVNLAGRQIEIAAAAAAAAGLADRVSFQAIDATDVRFPPGSFDAVLMLESFGHLTAKEHVMCTVAESLRPGGRLTISDLMGETTALRAEWEAFLPGAAPISLDQVVGFVRAAGLDVVTVHNLDEQTRRTIPQERSEIEARRVELVDAFGAGAFERMLETEDRLLALVRGHLEYWMITAMKPVG